MWAVCFRLQNNPVIFLQGSLTLDMEHSEFSTITMRPMQCVLGSGRKDAMHNMWVFQMTEILSLIFKQQIEAGFSFDFYQFCPICDICLFLISAFISVFVLQTSIALVVVATFHTLIAAILPIRVQITVQQMDMVHLKSSYKHLCLFSTAKIQDITM